MHPSAASHVRSTAEDGGGLNATALLPTMPTSDSQAIAEVKSTEEGLLLEVGGVWRLTETLPILAALMPKDLKPPRVRVVPNDLTEWDSSLPLFLMNLRAWCQQRGANLDLDPLPEALKQLFGLIQESEASALATPPRGRVMHPIHRVGQRFGTELKESVQFVGECVLAVIALPTDPRQFRWKDFFVEMVEAGPKALPIIGMLSFLIGLTFAYETASQLQQFGAQIYVVAGLALAVVRQIGPIIAAVVLAGRTGAAFAAHIGNMKLGGEIDALEMLGVSPVSFLALPRLAAVVLMMPLLTLYADLLGILGGLSVTVAMLGIPVTEFWVKVQGAISITDVNVGIVKSLVYGVLIGLAGTLRGLQCERTSAGVGRAATSAVVTGIAAIIIADALFAPILQNLGY